jgi:hypothetical protein
MTDIVLGYHPREWQKRCHAERERFTVLALHRRAGKTELAIMELIDAALNFQQDLGLFFYIAPYLKQAKTIAWARLKQKLYPLITTGAAEVNEGEAYVRFKHNGAMIRIFGADNPDAMRGVRLDGAVLDEVPQIKPETWIDIVQPALSDRMGWALFIGTPSGVNLFSELYYKAKKLPDWHSAMWTVYNTDALDKKEVERLKRDMSETSFAREYLCDFSAAGDDQLMSLSDIEEACARTYPEHSMDYAPVILGVDVARFGDDRSVIFRRQGLQAFTPRVFQGIDNMTLVAHIAQDIEQHNADACFIDVGGGTGVIDRLKQLGHDVMGVNFGGKPTQPQYLNKRAEMWFNIRDWIRAGGALPDMVDLKQDLGAPIYHFDASNKIVLEPKDAIKARGLPSPDLADALGLTFALPVGKMTKQEIGGHKKIIHEYDPYSNLTQRG